MWNSRYRFCILSIPRIMFLTETHTNQITPKKHYNACESSLFTHTFPIESLLCILNKIRYIWPQSTDALSFLHHSAIWIWWGSASCATNVWVNQSNQLSSAAVSLLMQQYSFGFNCTLHDDTPAMHASQHLSGKWPEASVNYVDAGATLWSCYIIKPTLDFLMNEHSV